MPHLMHQAIVILLSEYLWAQTASDRNAALNSAFVQGLKNATLDPEAFGNYMIQDSLFCYAVKNIIDIALKNATDPAVWKFLNATGASYESYYQSMFETWSIANASGVKSGPALSRYLNHELNVATTMDSIYVVVTLIPCAKLWPWLGEQLNVNSSSFGVYDSWVKTNFGYSSEYKTYETLINNAETWGHIDRHRALEAYRGSMSGEADFFNTIKTV
ncbi:uncharacterized protein LOC127856365 [Dreissena polymorpha]|uniref:uncharacterized protein LOC127856365 n=1 Tax=Dreissena polymorpha TaxID=45954 RepID=UPI002263BAB1|nr:uncharacterized protein LOC127856365 [Dreissena polymorpha]XP_052248470.1 uncharacterized protein LOC127856365 [Dreissena polymorpha]